MKQYLEMCKYVLENGEDRSDRTGTGTRSVFGYQTRYDLRDGFPLMTTKKMFIRPIAEELLWFIKGDTNIKYLVDRNVKIWNEWPYENYKKSKDYQGETIEEFIEKIKNLPEDDPFVLKYGDLAISKRLLHVIMCMSLWCIGKRTEYFIALLFIKAMINIIVI